MNNSTATSPLDYQWSPWKRPVRGEFPVSTNHLPLTYRRHVYVQEDWLASDVPVDWLVRFLSLIHSTPGITWLLSTFRPGDWLSRVEAKALLKLEMEKDRETLALREWLRDWINGTPPSNVWVGSPILSQEQANSHIPRLLAIPAVGRFLLCDPLVGPLDIQGYIKGQHWGYSSPLRERQRADIHWVSIGGETGPDARPCNIDWIRSLVRQCKDAAVPVRVERIGAVPVELNKAALRDPIFGTPERRVPGITHPDGSDPSEWPHDLRVREFPEGLR